jgi:hypothetical protein
LDILSIPAPRLLADGTSVPTLTYQLDADTPVALWAVGTTEVPLTALGDLNVPHTLTVTGPLVFVPGSTRPSIAVSSEVNAVVYPPFDEADRQQFVVGADVTSSAALQLLPTLPLPTLVTAVVDRRQRHGTRTIRSGTRGLVIDPV